jgi:hypothetical protein
MGDANGFDALGRDLGRLGEYLAYPETPDLAAEIAPRLGGRRPRAGWGRYARWVLVAAAVAAALALIFALWGDARRAVAEFFGLRRVAVVPGQVPAPTASVPAVPEFAGRTTLAEARARAGFPIRVPTYPEGLGEPDEVYLQELYAPGEVQVVLVYRTRPGLRAPGPGDLLFRLYAARTTGLFVKGPPTAGTVVWEVTVDGNRGYWLENATYPVRFRDAAGRERVEMT